jgi:arylsulfatase A-like enzyme/Tfp pilus assembly protein PilF
MLKTPSLLTLIALTACGGPAAPEPVAEPQAKRPNVLVFSLDTTRWDAIGTYGNKLPVTPHIDRLASEGVRFEYAYTVTPLTIPAHASMHTGLYPPRHGVRDNGDFFLDEGATTLAERFDAAGYATMASVAAEVTSHHWGFAQGFDTYYDDLEQKGEHQNRWEVERPGNEVVDDALEWLNGQERGEAPWFAWVHLFDAHHPYAPQVEFRKKIGDKPYLAEVAYVDAQVGRVVEALRTRGELDDTLIVVVSDHGEGLGDHGEQMHGMLLYNATMRVPLIMRPPGGLQTPRVETGAASIVDIAPTALALAGLDPLKDIDGIDLSGALKAGAQAMSADRDVYMESLYAYHHYGWAPQHALADGRFKLLDSTTPQLYARGDLYERKDLAGKDQATLGAMRERVRALLSDWEVEEGAAGRAELSAERMAQLEALGYVTAGAGDVPEPGEVLPDPVDKIPVLRKVEAARAAMQQGELDKAKEMLETILVEEPGLMPPRLLLGEVLQRKGDLKAALELARDAVEMRESTQTRNMLGVLLLGTGQRDEGLEVLASVIETDPYMTAAWMPYLHTLFSMGRLEELAAEVERAKLKIAGAPFLMALDGALLVVRGLPEEARPVLEQAIEADPQVPFAHHFLGVLYREAGDVKKAETSFFQELENQPRAVDTRRHLVMLYASEGRYEDQIAQLELIRQVEPPNPLTYHSLGQAKFNLGRYAEAKDDVDACRALARDYPGCAMLQANVLDKLGDREGALAAYHEALELAGQEPPAE